MDDEILAAASLQTLSFFITEGENFCSDEADASPLTMLCVLCISEHQSVARCNRDIPWPV